MAGYQVPPIAAIGCSAGGLEALSAFFKNIELPSGIGFLCLQHMAVGQEDQLIRLLSKISTLEVQKANDGELIQADTIYIVPAHTAVGVFQRRIVFLLEQKAQSAIFRSPIDNLFRSLAEDQQSKAIGILLSGTGTDGTAGLAAIKEHGGITFTQDKTAKYSGMPNSAIAAGYADYILPPQAIAVELLRLASNPYVQTIGDMPSYQIFKNEEDLSKVFMMLRSATGVDFSTYKETTIKRRIYRRMVLCRIDKLSNYVSYLSKTPSELQILHDDFLINVTSFFRDADSFVALQEKVFPEMTRSRDIDAPIRIWVPGCSTGEEAYSIAIALLEFLGDNINRTNIQIFATDISESAINKARKGFYLENINQDVSNERLRKYFKKVEGGYQIGKSVRDLCVFAKQNMTKDPPFSRLDLISCRNVLIYLGPGLQKNLIRTFHQALQPTGFLMLGTSETIGLSADLFHLIDKKNKIYSKKSALSKANSTISSTYPRVEPLEFGRAPVSTNEVRTTTDLQKEADRIVLARHAPAGVIVDEEMEIVHFRGQTGPYLEPAPGVASLNLLRMAREGLKLELRTAITRARKYGVTVRKEGLQVKYDGKLRELAIEAVPIKSTAPKQQFVLVLFENTRMEELEGPIDLTNKKKKSKGNTDADRQIKRLQQELADTKEYLQRNIEEQDAYNEELKSANEEIQSSNEELQSTNEELETAKEELQSINEELTTLNDELQIRNAELSQVNNDLGNLLANVNFTVVMVGMDLRIRRFNPMAEKVLNIIPTDIGRPISDIKPNVKIDDLEEIMAEVVDSLRVIEREVQDRNGHWFSLSIRPYKTSDNKIDGAVIIMIDIDPLKVSLDHTERSQEFLEVLFDNVKEGIVILQPNYIVETANSSFLKTFSLSREQVEGKKITEISNSAWNSAAIKSILEDALTRGISIANYRLTQQFAHVGTKSLLLNGRRISENDQRILLIVEEIKESL